MAKKDKFIQLGSCIRPHGIRGGFSAHLFNPKESSLKKGTSLLLRPQSAQSSLPSEGARFDVQKVNFGNKRVLYFDGVDTRNEVESMLPFDIYIERSALPEPGEDEFYIEDLVGLKVLDEKNNEIGAVKDHFNNGAQTVLVIQKKTELVELPLVGEFFPEINVEEGYIKMIEPEII